MRPNQTNKLCTTKESINKAETTYRVGENICEQCDQGSNMQNMANSLYRSLATTTKIKPNLPYQKGVEYISRYFSKDTYRWS